MPEIKLKSSRVLVVDDKSDLADAFAKLLTAMGQEVKTAYSGAMALEVAASWKPEIIFLDIAMPEMDGHETAKKLREIPQLKNTFLIALTGYGLERDVDRTRESGFDMHLIKPIAMEDIKRILSEVAEKRK